MHWILYPLAAVVCLYAVIVFERAENIIHQNFALNAALVASVLFVGGVVVQTLERISHQLEDEEK
jgi:hypothetical protein